MTAAAAATEEWAWSVAASRSLPGGRPCSATNACRAATSADRLPTVPPWTKHPPASSGMPARSASQRRAWFSAYTVPAALRQLPAYIGVAARAMSNSLAACEGAVGMKARKRGFSIGTLAGASVSAKICRAASPPMPSSVTVSPAAAASSSGVRGGANARGALCRRSRT